MKENLLNIKTMQNAIAERKYNFATIKVKYVKELATTKRSCKNP